MINLEKRAVRTMTYTAGRVIITRGDGSRSVFNLAKTPLRKSNRLNLIKG